MRRIALGLAVVAAAAAGFSLWPTDARAIRQTLAAAADTLSVPAGEGDLQRVARAAGLAKRLTTDVTVEAGPEGPSIQGRDTVVGLAARLRIAGPVTVSFTEIDLAVDGAAGRATARVAGHVSGERRGELERVDGTELTVELTRIDGAWLIARVTRVPDLAR
jgi:voltage-gated potassium channel Kch